MIGTQSIQFVTYIGERSDGLAPVYGSHIRTILSRIKNDVATYPIMLHKVTVYIRPRRHVTINWSHLISSPEDTDIKFHSRYLK